jgi:hypothetical protein
MTGIPLRIVEAPAEGAGYDGIQPGDMWADEYVPGEWIIMLPNRAVWYTWEHAAGTGNRWDVSGEAPGLTVSPSIWDQTPGSEWHGWIRDGHFETA